MTAIPQSWWPQVYVARSTLFRRLMISDVFQGTYSTDWYQRVEAIDSRALFQIVLLGLIRIPVPRLGPYSNPYVCCFFLYS